MKNQKNQKGFTLVELLIAILVSMFVMGAIMMSFRTGLYSSVGIEAKISSQQDVRAALQLMALELSMASYNPNDRPNIWRSITGDCTGAATTANQENKGIQAAGQNLITIQMDINGNGTIRTATNDQNEIITYTYIPAEQRITRSTNCGPAFDLLGCRDATGDGRCDNNNSLRSVRVINDANTPVFRYFDGSGNEITNIPANIPNIRRIDITLVVESDVIDPMTKQRGKMIYSSSIVPRNHPMP